MCMEFFNKLHAFTKALAQMEVEGGEKVRGDISQKWVTP